MKGKNEKIRETNIADNNQSETELCQSGEKQAWACRVVGVVNGEPCCIDAILSSPDIVLSLSIVRPRPECKAKNELHVCDVVQFSNVALHFDAIHIFKLLHQRGCFFCATPPLRYTIRTRFSRPKKTTPTGESRSQRNTTVSNRKFASYNDYVLVHFYSSALFVWLFFLFATIFPRLNVFFFCELLVLRTSNHKHMFLRRFKVPFNASPPNEKQQ